MVSEMLESESEAADPNDYLTENSDYSWKDNFGTILFLVLFVGLLIMIYSIALINIARFHYF